jgi:hypothetical protein
LAYDGTYVDPLADVAGHDGVGFDVAVLADDGRIQDVHGFLDRVPSQ